MSQGMQDAQTKSIDGYTYKCLMLDPLLAADMVADLGNILGPSLGALGGALASSNSKDARAILDEGDALKGDALERAVREFFARFTKAQQRDLIDAMSRVTLVIEGGRELPLQSVFAMHFRGRIMSMYRWLAWALQVQFGEFFLPLKGVIGLAGRATTAEK